MMNEVLIQMLMFLAGVGLALFFFGGLYWTVRKGVESNRPAILFFVSGIVRTIGTLAGFWFVTSADLLRIIICMLGFVIGRFVVVRWFSTSRRFEDGVKQQNNVIKS